MKRNIFSVLIIIGFLFLFYGFVEATGSYSSIKTEEQQEEAFPALAEEMIPIEEWGTVPEGISETETMVEYIPDQETDESFYDAYLKKIWIVDQEERDLEELSFVITEIKDGEIEGCLDIYGAVESDYCHQYLVESSSFVAFHGTVSEKTAVSSFEYDGNRTEFVIRF